MSNLLFNDEEETVQKMNIDDLFERNQRRDLKQLAIFNKILNRIYKRIQFTGKSRQDKFVFFQVPEYLFGEPLYNQGDCIGFLVVKLEKNGFEVKYTHPNTLFINWKNYVPKYVRSEIKKKTGVQVDEKGTIINKEELEEKEEDDITNKLFNDKNQLQQTVKSKKEYTPIDEYVPTGIYKDDMLKRVEKRLEKRMNS
jgi:hypothetical protein|uniref:Uncharacterized protein n=1 Tax=viral metagenome TaxID=1070528 RepID=A0A6C0IP32_9ZZZZ